MPISKIVLLGCLMLKFSSGSGHSSETGKGDQTMPNVLFIVIDDLNDWNTLYDPVYPIQLPHMQELAERGAFFTRAYCSSSACNPSRASVMTGTRPHKTGIYGNKSDWRMALPHAETIQQFFKRQGYYVGGAGKIFHHHQNWAYHDNASFDEYLMMKINEPYPPQKLNGLDDYGSRNTDWGPWPEDITQTADYKTSQYAIDFLKMNHHKPFFLNVGIYKPHSPFFVPREYFDRYPLADLEMLDLNSEDWDDLPEGASNLMTKTNWFWKGMVKAMASDTLVYREFIQAYQACSAFADAMIGRVLKALDDSPYRDNTIIVLWSDHGFHLGEKDHIEKFALWEKATHVPFIIVAPGQISPGTVIEEPVDLTTIYPTLVELCGLKKPGLDGMSVLPLLKGEVDSLPPALTTYMKGNHAIRTERWRYIQYEDGSEELYDHSSDPHEWYNLAENGKYTGIIEKLKIYIPSSNADQVDDLK